MGCAGHGTARRVDAEYGRTDMTDTDYGTDREILETAVRWLEQGHAPLLVTVARTWGASPRQVGSLMRMREDGVCRGSVSGGCVQDDLVQRLTAGASVVAPVYRGRRGHPAGFAGRHASALMQLQGDAGARGVIDANAGSLEPVVVETATVVTDIDTLGAYVALQLTR
jgi:hypothetical protein